MRVVQMLDALDFGDGVSNDVIHLQNLLNELCVENQIYSKWQNEKVAKYSTDIEQYKPKEEDLILYHFSGESHILEQVVNYPCRRIVRYHNVTPPEFFLPDDPQAYQSCREGLLQIQKNIHCFDGFWADSRFNAKELISYGADPVKTDVLPVIIDFEGLGKIALNQKLLNQLQKTPYVLFVGRVAPNKKYEDVLNAFENYYRYHGDRQTKLFLIGNKDQNSEYTKRLLHGLAHMSAKNNITFTGKVNESDLCTYYRAASAFLCMSEHEGFCIPLLEAQYFGVPVIAYASCAVPDTMGESGILIYKKNPALTADLLDSVLHDAGLRADILREQRDNIVRYQRSRIKKRLSELLKKWEDDNHG